MENLMRAVATLVALLVGGALVLVSRNDMLVAHGSESATSFYRPAMWAQALAVLLLGICVLGTSGGLARWTPLSRRRARIAWGVGLLLSLAAMAMSLHTLTLDDRHLREVWLLWHGQSVSFGEEGLPRSSLSQQSPFFLEVKDRKAERTRLFLGLPPWRIDPEPLLAHPLISQSVED